MKAVILAGGEGKRLRPLTENIPKPLVKLNDKSIIDYQIETFRGLGIRSFVILAGYKHEALMEHFARGYEWADISFSLETSPKGTGGAIKAARDFVGKDDFVAINGDVATNVEIKKVMAGTDGFVGKVALVPLQCPYGVISTSGDKIVGFEEKPVIRSVWINAGIYWFTNEVFDFLPDEGSIENLTFPQLASAGKLGFCKFSLGKEYWRSIDTLKDLQEIEKLHQTSQQKEADTFL